MDKATIRMGVVGAGAFASRRHIPDMQSNGEVEVVGICRRDPEQLGIVADHFGVNGRYTEYQQMLEDASLDAVLVSTPHALHYSQARAALARGLHVLLEKPMALEPSETEDLIALSEKSELVLAVALNPPFWKHTQFARETIHDGLIGDLEAVSISWLGNVEAVFGKTELPEVMPGVVKPTLYRGDSALGGGGHFMDLGSHLVSELLWVTGSLPVAVSAQMDEPVLDMRASVQVTLERNVFGTITAVGDSPHPDRRIQNVYRGSKGTLTVTGMPFRILLERAGEEPVWVEEESLPDLPGPVENFVDAIRQRAILRSSASHGSDVVRVISGAYQSAVTGELVAV